MSVSLKESFDIAYDGSENAALMDLFIDDVSDLSSLTHFDSIKILQGSTAKDISTGDLYQMQSDGTWVLQPAGIQLDLTGYYTSAETDTLLAGKQDSLSASQLKVINNIIMTDRNVYVQGSTPSGVIPVHSTWINGKTIKEYVDQEETPTVTMQQGSFETFSGSEIPSTTRVRTSVPTEISPPGEYTVSINGADDAVVYVYDENMSYSEADSFTAWSALPRTFITNTSFYIRYAFRHNDNSTIAPSDVSDFTVNFEGWQ